VTDPRFIFDPSKGQTPQSLAYRRRIAEALMRGGASPRTFGEGLAALGEGIAGRVMMNRIDKAERGMESANSTRAAIVDALASAELRPAPSPSWRDRIALALMRGGLSEGTVEDAIAARGVGPTPAETLKAR
jgi:hypothetical protein